MNLSQTLQQDGVIASMARELNIDEQTARSGAGALLPALVAGLGRSHVGAGGSGGSSPGGAPASGLGGLADILGGLAGGGSGGGGSAMGGPGGIGGVLLDQVLGREPTPTQPGNDILGQIFGTKEVSRGVADEAAGSTGLSSELLKKMLPILAMAVVGSMMKRGTTAGSGGISTGAGSAPPSGGLGGGGLGGILGQVVGGMMRR